MEKEPDTRTSETLSDKNGQLATKAGSDVDGLGISVRSLDDIKRISTIFIGSGMFKPDKSLSQEQQLYQAGVKIIAGVEFGIQPFAAMRGINIIGGNAEMSANLMAAKVKMHPKYDYRVTQMDNDRCRIVFYEIPYPGAPRKEWDELGESSFSHDDAVAAQLAGSQNWRKFARNMYFARAMSNGVRFYTPDVFYGAPVYVEGEIGGDFETSPVASNDDAEPIIEPGEPPVETKDEPVEGEVVSDKEDDEDKRTLAVVATRLVDLGIDEAHIRQLIRATTGKPFLTNCKPEDLAKLSDRIDRIESGDESLPSEWYDGGQAA